MVIAFEPLRTPSSPLAPAEPFETRRTPPALHTRRAPRSARSAAGMLPSLYEELRRVGRSMLRTERHGHLLEPCALVNEAYMRLHAADADVHDRAHCLRLVAQIMRHVLIDHARARLRDKRELPCPEELERLQLMPYEGQTPVDIVDIKRALGALAEENLVAAEMVQLHWYFGVDPVELEALFGVSEAGVTRMLRFASEWLAEFCSTQTG